MNKLESTIPFDGFYNSFISSDIEHEIGQQIEWDTDIYDLNEDEQQVLEDNYLSVNRSFFYNEIAEHYTDLYIDALNKELKGFTLKATYRCFESPREYNFETDRIFIDIERDHAIDFIKYTIKNYKKELENKIKERFTSRDGFWSHYKNRLDLWPKDYSEWDHNQIGTCFELFDFDELHFYESLSETIMNKLGNTLGEEGIDLLDKKQKEKDKKELMDKQQLKLKLN